MRSFNLRQTVFLVLLFVFVSATLILADSQGRMEWFRSPASQVFAPITWAFNQVGSGIGGLSSGNPSDLEAELEQLRAERDALLAENARLSLLDDEVAQLRNQLDFQERHPDLEPIPANVLSEDPKGVERILIIDQGRDAGIEPGMAVVSPDFFVGLVTNVDENRSRVLLVIDSAAQLGGMLQNTRAEGVVYGRWQAGGLIEMRHIDPNTEVQEGELVLTSGRTARVPGGLIIGRVSEIERDLQADTLSVRITPMVDFRALQAVTVILSDEGVVE
jgi:rod shape-determining protein MreC